MTPKKNRRVLVLVNPKSGLYWSFSTMRRALDRSWETEGTELMYQFSQGAGDGMAKAQRAVEQEMDVVLAVGGDGTVSTIGRALIGTQVAMGMVPAGSGNGFARHFGIPLAPEKAVQVLSNATVKSIDVGIINETPFLITASMAWDAFIVRSFEKSPLRGIVPYVFAGVQEFFEYRPQQMRVEIDGAETVTFPDPLVFTVANLTQYGGGAKIAPHAEADDGHLELVVALRQDAPKLVANIRRFFDGSIHKLPEVISKRFRSMTVIRERPDPIQIDGELVDAPARIDIHVVPGALKVLVPC